MKTAAAVALAATLTVAAASAQTNDDATLVAAFNKDDGTAALGVATDAIGLPSYPKGAILFVKYQHTDDHNRFDGTYQSIGVTFLSSEEWGKFAALWKKARVTAPPKEDDYMAAFDVGDYVDAVGETAIEIEVVFDGHIEFVMAGNPDENDDPKDIYLFELERKDFKAFDAAVAQVSAYFER